MTDLIDKANDTVAHFTASALSAHRLPEVAPKVSYSHCMDCGEPIPEARQKAVQGCKLCVLCQEYEEKGWP